jgi:hypothetical protein
LNYRPLGNEQAGEVDGFFERAPSIAAKIDDETLNAFAL